MRQRSSVVFALALLVAAGTLAFTGPASADEKEKNGKAEMAAAAKVAGKVVEAEVITAENKTMEVHIDADTGAMIHVEEQNFKPTNC